MAAGLTSLQVALPLLLDGLNTVAGVEAVTLPLARGRILAAEVIAPIDVPAADNSAMDGYAVRAHELTAVPRRFPVSQRIPAGYTGDALAPGSVARIFTGAALPPGADAVVMQENAREVGAEVELLQAVEPGENIRQRGEDIREGSALFPVGHRIKAQDLHVLSAVGMAELAVRTRLRVAVMTTGDELVRPGTLLKPGQIYNSNFYVIASLLDALGLEVVDLGLVGDSPEETVRALNAAADGADCILSSGGVSVGEEDHVKAAVEQLGRLDLWKLAIKPGKPFAFGRVRGVPFFGLPGNPVSAFVTFVLLVRPALLKIAGAKLHDPLSFRVPVAFSSTSTERQEYLRVKLTRKNSGIGELQLLENQSSGAGSSLKDADGLAVLPPFTSVERGDMLEFVPLSELTS